MRPALRLPVLSVISPSVKMPSKNKQKKTKKGGKKLAPMPSTIQPIRPFVKSFMGYAFPGTLTEPSAQTGAIYQVRLNSVYDPDYTSTGYSAQGYASYIGLYGLFRVLRVRLMVRFYSGSTGNMTIGFVPGMNSTVTANYTLLHAQSYAQSAILQGNTGGGHSVRQFDVTYDLAKIAGISRSQYLMENDYGHAVGANPVKSIFCTFFINGHSATVQSAGFECRLVYEVEMSQPLQSITG